MPKSISKITETKKQKVNLAMTYHTQIGALITESTRTLRSQEAAVERAQNRLNESTKSFNAQMHEAGAQSRDFKKATASCEEVYDFYRTCVVNALPKTEQAVIAGKPSEAKRNLLQSVSARMGSIGKALARMEGLANGTVTDGRTKKARAAKAETAKGKGGTVAELAESGTATEADSILPPAIRDPRLTSILNYAAQLSIEGQAEFVDLIEKVIAMREPK